MPLFEALLPDADLGRLYGVLHSLVMPLETNRPICSVSLYNGRKNERRMVREACKAVVMVGSDGWMAVSMSLRDRTDSPEGIVLDISSERRGREQSNNLYNPANKAGGFLV
jgi:hypothetical protein